jgi:fatty-acyl-CoA synthase
LTESYWPADTSEELLELTLGDLLRATAAEVPDRVALVEGVADPAARRRWTYAELLADAERVARALLGRFAPGERVAVYAANCPEWVLLQHGMSLAGILMVPLNPAYKAAEVRDMLAGCEAAGIVHADRFRDNDMAAVVAGLELGHLRERMPLSDLAALLAAADPAAEMINTELPAVAPDDPLQIQFTSGTTGSAKGALLHHRGVVNTCRYVALRAGFPEGGVWINAMPMFHIGGAAVTAIGCLSRRGTYVLAPGFDPAGTLELVESEGGNAMLVVPTMLQALLEHPDAATRDLSSIRTILSGAAAVPAALVTRTKRQLGCDFTILFGQTEINGVVCQTSIDDALADQVDTLGRPLPHAEVTIADPVTGEVLPLGEAGEIRVRGYQNMRGYHGQPEATRATLDEQGWLHTGDLATMDERGYLRIAGRLKDMIIRGGMNLYPREIEDVLFDHPDVAQVSVIGVPDPEWGEVVGAIVVPRDRHRPPRPEDLDQHCRARLAAHKAPRLWYLVDEFPLTPSGKIQKFRLRQMAGNGEITPAVWNRTPAGNHRAERG